MLTWDICEIYVGNTRKYLVSWICGYSILTRALGSISIKIDIEAACSLHFLKKSCPPFNLRIISPSGIWVSAPLLQQDSGLNGAHTLLSLSVFVCVFSDLDGEKKLYYEVNNTVFSSEESFLFFILTIQAARTHFDSYFSKTFGERNLERVIWDLNKYFKPAAKKKKNTDFLKTMTLETMVLWSNVGFEYQDPECLGASEHGFSMGKDLWWNKSGLHSKGRIKQW